MRAVVKFFNDLRGYGFVTADDLEEYVFAYSRVLNDCGFHLLTQGQKLQVSVDVIWGGHHRFRLRAFYRNSCRNNSSNHRPGPSPLRKLSHGKPSHYWISLYLCLVEN